VELTLTVFILLLLVALSGVTVRFLPRLPLPLLQVGMGALAALPGIGLRVDFDPGLFLLLFVSPLLFADGLRVSKREFFRLRSPIVTLARPGDLYRDWRRLLGALDDPGHSALGGLRLGRGAFTHRRRGGVGGCSPN
jgi:membrane protease YdiL (CAAX protease family)